AFFDRRSSILYLRLIKTSRCKSQKEDRYESIANALLELSRGKSGRDDALLSGCARRGVAYPTYRGRRQGHALARRRDRARSFRRLGESCIIKNHAGNGGRSR